MKKVSRGVLKKIGDLKADNEVLEMDWVQFILFGIGMGGMFAWLRSDIALNRAEAAADRRDILQIIREIQYENKDFHGRLIALEERNKK